MKNKFLAVDVGSSFVKFAFFKGDDICSVNRVEKDQLQQFFLTHQEDWNGVESAVASVSPSLHALLEQELFQQTSIKPHFLHFQDLNLELCVEEPENVGIDRILNCVAGRNLYRENLIILDLGTATTIDVVTNTNQFSGGMILPGVDTFKNSLFQNTEQLWQHKDDILDQAELPPNYLGKDTYEAIHAGVVGGYFSMIEGLLKKLKKELTDEYRVIATGGGLSRLNIKDLVSEIRPNLSLEGIKVAFDSMNKH